SVNFYSNPEPDPSGYGEGKTFLNGWWLGDSQTTATLPLHVAVPVGTYISATQQRTGDGTSEFSAAVRVEASESQPPATIVGRHVFYSQSAFDGSDPNPTAEDAGAMAPDKEALLPGQAPSFANVTSYTRGINGV